MPTEHVGTRLIPLTDLVPYPGNARRGDVDLVLSSLRANGQYRALVVRDTGGELVVLAGNHTCLALEKHLETLGDCPADCHVCALGDPEQALCGVIRCDDATALRINLVDNRANDAATYDDRELAALLAQVDDWEGTGYDAHDYDSLLTRLDEPGWQEQQAAEVREAKEERENLTVLTRSVPIDVIFSMGRVCSITLAAYEMGFLPGIISTSLSSARDLAQRLPGVRLGFMDNEWHAYDHAAHVAAVAETRPKYATVRDAMTREQCAKAGVEFYPLGRILEMAAEVAEHADNVIVIPKYDCLEEIPEEYVIGFSVPSSYGGSPMPASMLRGRRVHLLGGSWRNQRAYLDVLGDSVVSLDNNHLLRIAEWGRFYGMDVQQPLSQLWRSDGIGVRSWQAACVLSLAVMRDHLNEYYGTRLAPMDGTETPPVQGLRTDDSDEGAA